MDKDILVGCTCGCTALRLWQFDKEFADSDADDICLAVYRRPKSRMLKDYFKFLWNALLGRESLESEIVIAEQDWRKLVDGWHPSTDIPQDGARILVWSAGMDEPHDYGVLTWRDEYAHAGIPKPYDFWMLLTKPGV